MFQVALCGDHLLNSQRQVAGVYLYVFDRNPIK